MRPGMQVCLLTFSFWYALCCLDFLILILYSLVYLCISELLLFSILCVQNTASPEGNIRHLVYLIENAILNLPEGQEQMSWLIDFNGWSLNTNIPITTARDIIYVLQNHYPERLAIVVLYSPPRFFEAFYKVWTLPLFNLGLFFTLEHTCICTFVGYYFDV